MSRNMADQLQEVRPYLGMTPVSHKVGDAVTPNLSKGTASIEVAGLVTEVALTPEDQREFIENSKALQKAAIRERRMSGWAHTAVLALTIVTAAGAGYAAYKGTGGSTGNRGLL